MKNVKNSENWKLKNQKEEKNQSLENWKKKKEKLEKKNQNLEIEKSTKIQIKLVKLIEIFYLGFVVF